jgi:hypothetical protein
VRRIAPKQLSPEARVGSGEPEPLARTVLQSHTSCIPAEAVPVPVPRPPSFIRPPVIALLFLPRCLSLLAGGGEGCASLLLFPSFLKISATGTGRSSKKSPMLPAPFPGLYLSAECPVADARSYRQLARQDGVDQREAARMVSRDRKGRLVLSLVTAATPAPSRTEPAVSSPALRSGSWWW